MQGIQGASGAAGVAPAGIAPGDIVRLKSGGPPMTAGAIDKDGDLGCFWFVMTTGTAHEMWFPPAALVKLAKSVARDGT